MSQTAKKPQKKSSSGYLPIVVIIINIIIGFLFWRFVCGADKNFDELGHPLQGNFLGIIYKGGFIVPILFGIFLTMVVFSIERALTISKAKGKGSVESFLQKVKYHLSNGDIDSALKECDKQQGSVANVVNAGLHKYAEMKMDREATMEQKVLNISKEIEEATALEMPALERHLPILATIASIGTLIALLGTVIGMIRAFAALATTGSPDPAALSAGISEALINTAIGIGTSAFAIIGYNVFTGMIDKLTYGIDEMGFSISQTFAAKEK
ncbi:MAG: MotA/TolQ/ExbB proton channel family protein [Fimbriimonadaceae bacterium]|nr:MotA/TolQ/ExbB proton channel family protein [Chitinophagales bacterium]